MTVFLVPVGRNRFELYSEAPEETLPPPSAEEGRLRRWMHRVSARWHDLVEHARRGHSDSRISRWRNTLVCKLAENIAEQRTLWSLRSQAVATLRYPTTQDEAGAREILMRTLDHARRHHLRWSIIDGLLFVGSVVFFFIPGPNLVAYYFAFRFIGHLQSWRGARQGHAEVRWTFEPDPGLAELGALVDVEPAARAPRVAAIAAALNLRRLSAFYERVAMRST